MIFKSLEHTKFDDIVACFLDCFSDYSVKMPKDIEYYRKRWLYANVDFSFSYGAFVNKKLIAFFIHAYGTIDGKKTLFNTGTGVIQEYRGNRLMDKLYKAAWPKFKKKGIQSVVLEVLETNAIAINTYERIGFIKNDAKVLSFTFQPQRIEEQTHLVQSKFESLKYKMTPYDKHYTWDNSLDVIERQKTQLVFFDIRLSNRSIGYAVIDPIQRKLLQIESYILDMSYCFSAVASKFHELKMTNIPEFRKSIIENISNTPHNLLFKQFMMSKVIQK